MDKLINIVDKRLNQHRLGDSASASQIIFRVNQLLTDKFGSTEAEVKALTLKDGTLKIGTVSSVWSQELWAYQEPLIQLIQKEYGPKSVIKILISGLN